jgi:hypothetical protein
MFFADESELEELKIQIDQTADWFNNVSFGDELFTGSINDLVDIIVPFVQNKLYYCTNLLSADRQKRTDVTKLSGRLNSDFFLETQRILKNCTKSSNPIQELKGEFIYYDYHFQYSSSGFFYYVDDSQEPRMVVEVALINTIATLKDYHSPYFEAFIQPVESEEGKPQRTKFDNANYQFLLRLFLHKWLREQIVLHTPPSKNAKTSKSKKQLSSFVEMLKDPTDFNIVLYALDKCGCLNTDQTFNETLGNKTKVVSLFHVLKNKGYFTNEANKMSSIEKAKLFNLQFNCKIVDRQLREEPNERLDHYQKFNSIIPNKIVVTKPYSPPQ